MLEVIILTIIPDLTKEEYKILLPLVASEKQKQIKRFRYFQDARNCLLGDILVRAEICRISNFLNNQLVFSTNIYGKPMLINNPQIHFNISHKYHYVVCAISDKPVGIDIEVIKSIDMAIANRFFTPYEIEYINKCNKKQRFYEIWTKKEAQIKWEGKGLYKPLNSFCVLDLKKPFIYHQVFHNREAICHVYSNIAITSIKCMDTIKFMRYIKNNFKGE